MRICILGGGPAGAFSAIFAKRLNPELEIHLYEKNEKIGKKLYITGKGRCNITNFSDEENLINNTINNPYFMYSSYYSFNSQSTVEFFEEIGLRTKVERGNRVFPQSDKSSDVINVLVKEMKKLGVNINLKTEIYSVEKQNGKFKVKTTYGEEIFDKLVIATGGLSYPQTGSTGDGYKFAKKLGHSVTKLNPALVPLRTEKKSDFVTLAQGLSLKNISVKALVNNKCIYEEQGEMLFTHFGVTGPLILKSSAYFAGQYNKECKLILDLKPALDHNQLDKRILRDFENIKNKELKNAFDSLLPQKFLPLLFKYTKLDMHKKVNEVTKEERKTIIECIKGMEIYIKSDFGYSGAVITSGGIEVDEIDPSTMESKICEGLYFAGEVIDVHCFTGGYNLQVTYSTGYLVGQAIGGLQ